MSRIIVLLVRANEMLFCSNVVRPWRVDTPKDIFWCFWCCDEEISDYYLEVYAELIVRQKNEFSFDSV